jgi:uncharacterized protein (TIGR00369 family)
LPISDSPARKPRRPGLGCAFFDELPFRHLECDGEPAVELEINDELRGPAGSVHGGLVSMLVDVAGAGCLAAVSGRLVATADSSIQYLAAGRVGPIRATGRPLRVSDTAGVAEVRVVDVGKDNRLVAVALLGVRFLDGEAFVHKTS